MGRSVFKSMIINSEKLKSLLLKKKDLVDKGRAISEKIDLLDSQKHELEADRHALILEVKKLQDKAVPLIEKLVGKLDDDKDISKVSINTNGEIEVEIIDLYQVFKARFKDQNK